MKKNFLIWIIIGFLIASFYNIIVGPSTNIKTQNIAFSDFLKELNKDNVLDVKIKGDLITGNLADGRKFKTYTR